MSWGSDEEDPGELFAKEDGERENIEKIKVCLTFNKKTASPPLCFLEEEEGPPFFDFSSNSCHRFTAISVKDPSEFLVQSAENYDKFEEFEKEMTAWYDNVYSTQKMHIGDNWIQIRVGGYYVAYLDVKRGWKRCWIDEIIHSEDMEEFRLAKYNVLVFLIDHGSTHLLPRYHILPITQRFLQLPMMCYNASLHFLEEPKKLLTYFQSLDVIKRFKEDVENKEFIAVVCKSVNPCNKLINPYQSISIVIIDYGETDGTPNRVNTIGSLLKCGYMRDKNVSSSSVDTSCIYNPFIIKTKNNYQ